MAGVNLNLENKTMVKFELERMPNFTNYKPKYLPITNLCCSDKSIDGR